MIKGPLLRAPMLLRSGGFLGAWALVLLLFGATLFAIRARGASLLDEGLRAAGDPCLAAAVDVERAHRSFREAARQARDLSGGAEPGRSSLGVLAGDAELLRQRDRLLDALVDCPGAEGADRLLASFAWWLGDQAEAHFRLGREARRFGRPGAAAVEFLSALEMDPANLDYIHAAAAALLDIGAFADARRAIDALPPDLLDAPQARFLAAMALDAEGRPAEAIAILEQVLRASPAFVDAHDLMLRAHDRAGRSEEGARLFVELSRGVDAVPARLHHAAGIRLGRAGLWQEALEPLQRAARLAPYSVDVLFTLCEAQHRTGSDRAARATIERASAIDARRLRSLAAESGFDPFAVLFDE